MARAIIPPHDIKSLSASGVVSGSIKPDNKYNAIKNKNCGTAIPATKNPNDAAKIADVKISSTALASSIL